MMQSLSRTWQTGQDRRFFNTATCVLSCSTVKADAMAPELTPSFCANSLSLSVASLAFRTATSRASCSLRFSICSVSSSAMSSSFLFAVLTSCELIMDIFASASDQSLTVVSSSFLRAWIRSSEFASFFSISCEFEENSGE